MTRAATGWLGLAWLAFALLPWYALPGEGWLDPGWLRRYPGSASKHKHTEDFCKALADAGVPK